jgi:hypothetical protein
MENRIPLFLITLHEVYVGGNASIATEALARIKLLYDIEAEIRGQPPLVRRAVRQQCSKSMIEALKPWLEASCAKVPKGGKLAKALGYGLNHWDGLCRDLDDGRIEIDSNTVERSIRGLALTRKNALFAGHDRGAAGWTMIAALLETCKLNRVDLLAWTTDVFTKLVNLWPRSRIGELMPWLTQNQPEPGSRWVAGPLTEDKVLLYLMQDATSFVENQAAGKSPPPFSCQLPVRPLVI